MERPEALTKKRLPGYDALIEHQGADSSVPTPLDVRPYKERGHWAYLDHPTYDHYLKMHKIFVGRKGADELARIGEELSGEYFPRYLDAAGWAFAEAGLMAEHRTAIERVAFITKGERQWEQALRNEMEIADDPETEDLSEESTSLRIALNLAYAPLMKSIVVGNVTSAIRHQVFADTLAIASLSAGSYGKSIRSKDRELMGEHRGLLHEMNALLALLYMDDPRYIPLPSSARADSGYYHRDQTHDITVVNQNWGSIRKIIPIEVKDKPSNGHRRRYKALLIKGKTHLSVDGKFDPRTTLDAYDRVFHHTADITHHQIADKAAMTVKDLLWLYQRGASAEMVAMDSLTKFHDASQVREVYKEMRINPSHQSSRRV